MRLATIKLKNYRRFDAFRVDLHPELTVIAARNGQGKTTILEAIAAALGPFVGAFDMGRTENIARTDARYVRVGKGFENEQAFPVVVDAASSEPDIVWQRALRGPKGRTSTREAKPLADWGAALQKALRDDAAIALPVVRYYSSRRLWTSHRNTAVKGALTQSRTAGYEDCLSSLSSFAQLQQWMRKATMATLQQRDQPGYEGAGLESRLKGIGRAVDEVMAFEGWRHFHHSLAFDELAMVHPDHGALPVSLLSDGVRAMISLTADLALRCVRLNGHWGLEAPQRSQGIVLIDEVDLHLHPAWQQQVVSSLRRAFPRLQFVMTSHSPQLLSTVERSSIRVVFQDPDGKWHASQPAQEVVGLESAVALAEVMGVSAVPPVDEAQLIADYTAVIEEGTHEQPQGRRLRERLVARYGAEHPVILDADRLIRFQRFKLSKPQAPQRLG